MTQQEFFERTKVEVSNDEFLAINEVYNYSDLDKDDFCKLWCKMNRTRVKAAKAAEMEAKLRGAYNDALFEWFTKWQNSKNFQENYSTNIAYIKLSVYMVQAMSYAGIRFGNAETLSDVHYKVGKYHTERYTRVMDEQKKAAMQELSKLMKG